MKIIKSHIFVGLLMLLLLLSCNNEKILHLDKNELRAPAYPLVTIDPYTSAWSSGDNLYDSSVKHWTGQDFPLIGVVKVDGIPYRFMGIEDSDPIVIAGNSELVSWTGKYTNRQPANGWEKTDFNDAGWQEGEGAFGTMNSEATAKTSWDSEYIWVRRVVDIQPGFCEKEIYLDYSHDDDAVFYVNGIQVADTGHSNNKHVILKLPEEVVSTLKPGKNLIAASCRNRNGGGIIDFGLFAEGNTTHYFEQTARQLSADVQPMRTLYQFSCGPVQLNLTFTAPLLMENLELVSRPVNYISYEIISADGKTHEIELYVETSPRWAINLSGQPTVSEVITDGDLIFLKNGSQQQNILGMKGDDVRIDWGYFYLGIEQKNTLCAIGGCRELRESFLNNEKELFHASSHKGENKRTALVRSLGTVKKTEGCLLIGYDDIFSIQYFEENLRPYWNRNGTETILSQFHKANSDYEKLMKKCITFDYQMMKEATEAGGRKYAELCALAYRQAIAAHKLVEAPNKDLLFLSKESSSNGSIGTVDITYPSVPLFLLYNPELAKGMMNPIFYYSESGKWTKPFAAHDVGTYPLANGETYIGEMPVEESGNMLVLTALIAAVEGNADYALKHWEVLTVWADYLLNHGLDPENQLCTDDFAGHLAHNANLSIKAILGVASYGYLADKLGKKELGETYTRKAKEMAVEWEKMAFDGDHYKLAFDQEGTWSQKYNLVWDKLMNWQIFPSKVIETEIPYYLSKQNKYGLPLDNRETYTKTDWIMWTATLASEQETFEKFIEPVYLFMNETTDRVPMTDWMYTDRPEAKVFHARSVVGGYFIKMLEKRFGNK